MNKKTKLTAEGLMLIRSRIAKLDKKIQSIDASIARTVQLLGVQDEQYVERTELRQEVMQEREELQKLLSEAELINVEDDLASDTVDLGHKVRLTNHTISHTVTIVDTVEANPAEGRVSVESPIGKSIIGRKIGEVVNIQLPTGIKEFTIAAIL